MTEEARTLENVENGVTEESVSMTAHNDESPEIVVKNRFCRRWSGCQIFFAFLSGVFTCICVRCFVYYMTSTTHEDAVKYAVSTGLLAAAGIMCLVISFYLSNREYVRSTLWQANFSESCEASGRQGSYSVAYATGLDRSENVQGLIRRQISSETDETEISETHSEQLQADIHSSELPKANGFVLVEGRRIPEIPDARGVGTACKVSEVASEISKIVSETVVQEKREIAETSKASTESKEQTTAEIAKSSEKNVPESEQLSIGEVRRRRLPSQEVPLISSSDDPTKEE